MGVRSVNGPDPLVAPVVAARAPDTRPHSADLGAASNARVDSNASGGQAKPAAIDIVKEASASRAGTRMRIDAASKRVVAQIVNENNEVIKQIPPEDVLKIAARFRELRGKLFDQKV